MAGLSTGAGAPTVKVYHEKSMILPDVSRVLACLYEKDVKFECVKDSYKDILRLQASRSVPVPFYDGPTFLQESRAICRYIAETYEQRGYPFLLGKDVLERASIEQWLRHEEHAFDPPSRALFCHLAFPLHDEDNDDINREKRKLEEVLAVYEQRLGESEFLAGDKFTLADLVHLPSTHHIVTSEKFAYLYDSRKNVQRWWNTISTRDSWQQVLRNMKSVEELEELEQQQLLLQQQQQQWQAEPPPTSGYRNIRIDPGKQTGTESRTILVPPPSAGQKSKAQPTDLKVKSPLEAELKEDTQGVMSGDERFSTKRLRKMLEESEAAEPPPTSGGRNIRMDPRKQTGTESRTILVPPPSAGQQRLGKMFEENEAEELKSQSTDSQAPEKEETPSVYKKPSDVQDRKSQADTVLADGKTGTPSTGTQAPDTPTSADERRATPPPKGEMARDDRGATEPRKPPSSNEQESQQRSEQEKMASQSGDERFSTKRLRRMLEESEAAALKSQSTDSQAPAKEETPSVYKKPSDVQDRKSQAHTVLAEGKTGTPSTSTQAPDTPTSADERRATPPPKGEMARDDRGATEPRKSPSSNEQESAPPVPSQSAPPSPIQQVSRAAPSIDELDKTAGVDRRAPPSTPKQTPTDARNALAPVQGAAPSADGISDKQSDKSTMDERALEKTPRQAPPSDTRHTSASIQGEIRVPRGPSDDMLGKTSGTGQIPTPAASKPTPTRGEVPDVHDTGDDATKKPAVDTKAAPTQQRQEPVLRSQQTTEQIKGVAPTSHGITGDELSKIAIADESATPPAPVQAPASDGRIASTALKGGILDARGKNEAVKPSVADPRGMLTTPRIPAPTPDTQRRTTSDQASDQAPPLPSFADTRNEKTDIAEAGRTNTIAPNEQPGGRIPKNAGAPAAGPSPMKSWKNMNEAHKDEPSIQQLSSDQSRAQLAENKKQGDDATTLTEIGKPKENDFLANVNQNNTGQAQVASADGPSKLQMHSDQNKPISSEDIGKRTNEIVSYRSSATSREMPPSVPEKSMREKQLQGDKSSTSLQDNVKQGSEAALLESGTEQLKKRDLLANVDQNSGKTPGEALQKSEEQTSSDTQQVKSNTGNSKSDGSSKPTQFDGNKGNLPESQRRDSSTNP